MKRRTLFFTAAALTGGSVFLLRGGRRLCHRFLGRQPPAAGQAATPLSAPAWRPLSLSARDGLYLHAEMQDGPSNHWAICVHGYRQSGADMADYAAHYRAKGWNVLLPDLRAHGESGGDLIGMGWPDRLDLLLWVRWLLLRNPKAVIVLHGVSMGAAAVLMATGEELPPNVAAAVSDSSFTSAIAQFRHVSGRKTRLPFPLVMAAVNLFAKLRMGYTFAQAAPLRQVRRSVTPTLFLHGGADTFIPPKMSVALHRAAACRPKALVVVPGAAHARSLYADGALYWASVDGFLARLGLE